MPVTNVENSIDFSGQKFYVGLDVHKRSWTVTVRSLERQVAHFTQPPDAKTLANTLKYKFPGGTFHSAYEAGFCGTSHHEQLCKFGIKNIIVHAADVPVTDKQKKNKTDLHDSRAIAEHLEKKNLDGIYIHSKEQQELRALFRLRESRVKDVTRSSNRLKSFLMYHGIVLPETILRKDILSKKALEWLDNLELASTAGTLAKQDLIDTLRHQRAQEYKITKLLRIQIQSAHSDAYQRLLTIPGIGAITAIAFITEIGDFSRFDNPAEYISYLGLTPWNDSSGETIRTKGIQPRCNKHLRPLIVEVAWAAIRISPQLFAYYSKHAVKNNKHAIIKVAKKIALAAKAVVLKKQNYAPDYLMSEQKVFKASAEQHIKSSSKNLL